MKAVLQCNKNYTLQEIQPIYAIAQEEWDEFNYLLFTSRGGTPDMDARYKTVPPIKADLTGEELQVKKDVNQIKLSANIGNLIDAIDFLNEQKSGVIKVRTPFRLTIIYSSQDKNILAPKITIQEKPYSFISNDILANFTTAQLYVIYRPNNMIAPNGSLKENEIFCKYTKIGDIIRFSGIDDSRNMFRVINVQSVKNDSNIEIGKLFTISQMNNLPFPFSISRGQKIINESKKKMLAKEYSFIAIKNNIIPVSPFRFMQVSEDLTDLTAAIDSGGFNITDVVLSEYASRYDNQVYKPIDLIGYNKMAICAKKINQNDYASNFTDYVLSRSVNPGDIIINLTSTSGLSKGDYLTITYDDFTNIYEEIVKVKDIISSSEIAVERGKFGTTQIAANTSAIVKKSKSFYFQIGFFGDPDSTFEDFYYDTVILSLEYL